jgi:AcrR family transcriptional regulator
MRKLLDAAMVVFDRRGYHAARVDDIVKVARTSHGTFYLYFANKEDLFRALVTDVADEMLEVADSLGPISSGPSGYRELRDWLASFYDVYWRYAPVVRAWTEAASDEGEFAPLGISVASAFTRKLSQRVREATPTPGVDPIMATMAMVAMIERSNYYLLARRLDHDRDTVVDTLAAIVHQGLFGGSRRAARAGRGTAGTDGNVS